MSTHSTPNREIWKDIVGFIGYYQISNFGQVKSLDRFVPMADGRKYHVKEKLLKLSWDGHYLHVILSGGGQETCLLVHRLVLAAFVGPCPEGMEACHNDGDARNNRPDNLRWDTTRNNHLDKTQHGTNRGQPPGEGHWNNKLSEATAREIKRRALQGERPCNLGREYGVSEATIRDIRNGRSWKHI